MTLSGVLPASLVLLAAGPSEPQGQLLEEAGPALAAALGLALAPALDPADPPQQLSALHRRSRSPGAPPRLVPLPIDPGRTLDEGSCWAEALGAWRQPALLLLSADQQRSGLPAAMTALLRQAAVPLVGLVQWGLPWQAALRRRDGLPWLGALPTAIPADPGAAEACEELVRALPGALRLGCAQVRAAGWQEP
ncbi:hypothetical protein [Cyanobium sp. NIES-981]|uniref:hypothetical protein n=1 Tax=Cyanobium sp. NIES-981 TaxID=1851505 RepID=UPI0007DDDA99|nr:hypothetical protein [Cyanobium sp. NIES-981]SBO42915.1 conserved protein of unknown function [Cyanobium sp. NIES-981]